MLELLTKLLFLYLPFQIALNPAEGVDLASVRVIIPLLFLAWLINALKNKKLIIPDNFTFLLLFSFLFFSCFSLFFASNPTWGFRKLLFLFSIFPLFFIINDIFPYNYPKILSLLKFTVLGAFLAALVGIIQFVAQFIIPLNIIYSAWAKIIVPFLGHSFSQAVLTNPSWLVNIGGHTLLRSTAFFPDPHMLAFYLNICALISLGIYFYQKENKLSGNLYLIIFLILSLGSFLTFSRGGYLGLISGLLFFGFFTFKSELKNFFGNLKKTALTTFVFFILLSMFTIPNPVSRRLLSSFNLSEGSNLGRIQTWQQSAEIIKNNPITGVGLGNYSLSVKPSADYREPIYSHNTFLDIAAETGIFNFLIWLILFLFVIINFTRNFLKKNHFIFLGLAAALVSFSVHSLFETAIFSVHILPLIILILSLQKNNATPRHCEVFQSNPQRFTSKL